MTLPEWLQGRSDEDVVRALRENIVEDHQRLADVERIAFIHERVDEPESDLAAEWDAYRRHVALVEARVARLRSAALDRFDREVAPLPAAQAAEVVYGDDDVWFPGFAAARKLHEDHDEPDLTPEEKLEHAIAGTRPASRHDLAGGAARRRPSGRRSP